MIAFVGYGDNYFIIKNSWGSGWGDKGYAKLAINHKGGVCGVQTHVSYPDM